MKRLALLSGILFILLVGFGLLRSPFTERSDPAPQTTFSQEDIKSLYLTRGCTNCHDTEQTLVGPSLKAIAARYQADADARAILLNSLRMGSAGKWGNVHSMPAHAEQRLSDLEAKVMIDWILELANSQ